MAVMQAAADSDKRRLRVVGGGSCKSGCHSCCHRHVDVTVGEAAVMVSHLRQTGGWADVRRAAKALADTSRTCSPDSWFKMKTRCPVLREDNTCAAYPVRPPACSLHVVTSDPAGCDPWGHESVKFEPVDMSDLYLASQLSIRESLPKGGIMSMTLPLPLALLLADRVVVRKDLSFEQAMSLIWLEA